MKMDFTNAAIQHVELCGGVLLIDPLQENQERVIGAIIVRNKHYIQ